MTSKTSKKAPKLLFTPPSSSSRPPEGQAAALTNVMGRSVNLTNTWVGDSSPSQPQTTSPLPALPKTTAAGTTMTITTTTTTHESKQPAPSRRSLPPQQNAVQKSGGVWRYTGGKNHDSRDVPAQRSSAIQLERQFDALMRIPSQQAHGNSTVSNNNRANEGNDFLAIQADVDASIAQRQILCLCTNLSEGEKSLEEQFKHVDSSLADSLGINANSISKVKKVLSEAIYVQKHTDLILSGLVAQVELACLEQVSWCGSGCGS